MRKQVCNTKHALTVFEEVVFDTRRTKGKCFDKICSVCSNKRAIELNLHVEKCGIVALGEKTFTVFERSHKGFRAKSETYTS